VNKESTPSPRIPAAPVPVTPARPTTGWAVTVVLALLAAALSVVNPALLIFVPLAFLLIAMPPRRSWLAFLGLLLLGATFLGQSGGTLWWFGRGWALILSAWFVVAVALLPQLSLTMRALTAVSGAAASAALLFVFNRRSWESVDWTVTQQLRNGAADIRAFWTARMSNDAVAGEMSNFLGRFAEWQANAYPAMLALGSLASLALAWWLWRRLVAQDARPLGPLREFRFSDHMVWLAVAGVMLVVLPFGAAFTRTGANLLAFMAALYAVRGFAVMLWMFGTPGVVGALFGAVVFVLLYPLVMATTLLVGLTDTWLDLRARRLTRQDHEKS
jgi:hypothetical protein